MALTRAPPGGVPRISTWLVANSISGPTTAKSCAPANSFWRADFSVCPRGVKRGGPRPSGRNRRWNAPDNHRYGWDHRGRVRETNANEPPMTHRNQTRTASKPESPACSGNIMEETYLLAMQCPVYRRRDSNLGFRAELENLAGADNGKGTSGRTARPKVRCARPGADCSVVALKRGNTR